MSEPYWSALGGGAVDYEGAWAAGTQYAPGDVVRHGGVDYLAVNPSLGVNPGVATGLVLPAGIGTSLPASPVDGEEFVLVDSLTAPNYQWRFRYVASITDAYKWVFIGGVPMSTGYDDAAFATGATWQGTYTTLAGVPRAGIYDFEHHSVMASGGAGEHQFRFRIATNTAIAGARIQKQDTQSGNQRWLVVCRDRLTVAAAVNVGIEIYSAPGGTTSERINLCTPVRVS